MTLTGKQNHYKVKFLRGYEFSINVKDSKIIIKDTTLSCLFMKLIIIS